MTGQDLFEEGPVPSCDQGGRQGLHDEPRGAEVDEAEAAGERPRQGPHLPLAARPLLAADRHAHELVGPPQVAARLLQVHQVHQHPPAGADQQRRRRLLHHAGVDVPHAQGVEEVGAQHGEAHGVGAHPGPPQQGQRQQVVGVAERGDAHGPAAQVGHGAQLPRQARSRGQGEERQPAGGEEAHDAGPAGVGGQRHVEGGGGVVDGAAHQRLHGGAAAAEVDELDVQPLLGEVAVVAGHLVGHHAEELAAEAQGDLAPLLRPQAPRPGQTGERQAGQAGQEGAAGEGTGLVRSLQRLAAVGGDRPPGGGRSRNDGSALHGCTSSAPARGHAPARAKRSGSDRVYGMGERSVGTRRPGRAPVTPAGDRCTVGGRSGPCRAGRAAAWCAPVYDAGPARQ